MKAVWLENNKLSYRTDVPKPEPGPQEALVKVSLAGICATDLELVKGYYPYCGIPGHEFVGSIVAAPDQPQRIGERVVGEINISCGVCPTCLAGRKSHCRGIAVSADGSMIIQISIACPRKRWKRPRSGSVISWPQSWINRIPTNHAENFRIAGPFLNAIPNQKQLIGHGK